MVLEDCAGGRVLHLQDGHVLWSFGALEPGGAIVRKMTEDQDSRRHEDGS